MTASLDTPRIPVDWYFDFNSPFAYLQLEQFDTLPPHLDITFKPVVLGALLEHWHTRGPAEIPGKRRFTYRFAHFRAQQMGIPFRMPPEHPFNPIKVLRLALALGPTRAQVQEIFRFIWRDGQSVCTEDGWRALCDRLDVQNVDKVIEHPEIKAQLRAETDAAAARGVFGVPTFVLGDDIFWGEDAMPMFKRCLADPAWLQSDEVRRISDLPIGIQRSL